MKNIIYILIFITSFCQGQNLNILHQLRQEQTVSGYTFSDSDAKSYSDAVGTLNDTQKEAIDDFVVGLKSDGLWSKLKAIYPFIGNTAAEQKWNLKDSRDLDEAFRLTFYGGITHESYGIKGDGSSGYADTHFVPSTELSLNSQSVTIAVETNNSGVTVNPVEIGTVLSVGDLTESFGLNLSPNFTVGLNDWDTGYANGGVTSGIKPGIYSGTRVSSTTKAYKNGTELDSVASTGTLPSYSVYLLAANAGGSASSLTWSNQGLSFVSLGDGLTGTEISNLHARIETLNTDLGR